MTFGKINGSLSIFLYTFFVSFIKELLPIHI